MINFNKVLAFLLENKEGAILGAISGYLVFLLLKGQGFDFSIMGHGFGIIDIIVSQTKTATETVLFKAQYAFILIGTTIGIAIDAGLKEGYFRKWLK